jgi:hypothetical protein
MCDRRLPRDIGKVFVAIALLEDQLARNPAKLGPVGNIAVTLADKLAHERLHGGSLIHRAFVVRLQKL